MWDVHTVVEPILHYGCYADHGLADRMAAHLAGVLHTPMVVDEVQVEPWRPLLLPQRLTDLPDWWEVWVPAVQAWAVGHRTGRSGTAACGTHVLPVPITAGLLRDLPQTRLCPACWPSSGRRV